MLYLTLYIATVILSFNSFLLNGLDKMSDFKTKIFYDGEVSKNKKTTN